MINLNTNCSLTDLVHELQQQFVFKLIIVLKLQHKLELFLLMNFIYSQSSSIHSYQGFSIYKMDRDWWKLTEIDMLRIYCSLTDLVHELQQQFVFKLIIVLKLQHKLELWEIPWWISYIVNQAQSIHIKVFRFIKWIETDENWSILWFKLVQVISISVNFHQSLSIL
jgi:hypothetical protein